MDEAAAAQGAEPEAAAKGRRGAKVWRTLRAFAKEYVIIVVGVLTALAGQQLVETLDWRQKVADADGSLRRELAEDVRFAAQQQALNPCARRYVDLLEAAIVKNRPDAVAALQRMGMPSPGYSWRSETWSAALAAQIPEHLPPERLQDYSAAFRLVSSESAEQAQLIDLYGQSWAGRFGHLDNPVVAVDLLKLVNQIRINERARFNITRKLLAVAKDRLGFAASPRDVEADGRLVAQCDADLNAIPTL